MKEIDKVAYIETVKGQILVAKSKGKDKFYIPGGKREGQETDEETLIRKIREELKVDIIPASHKYAGTFSAQADGHAEGIIVKMMCYKAQYEGTLTASSEIEEIKWVNYGDMDLVSHVDMVIFQYLKGKGELE